MGCVLGFFGAFALLWIVAAVMWFGELLARMVGLEGMVALATVVTAILAVHGVLTVRDARRRERTKREVLDAVREIRERPRAQRQNAAPQPRAAYPQPGKQTAAPTSPPQASSVDGTAPQPARSDQTAKAHLDPLGSPSSQRRREGLESLGRMLRANLIEPSAEISTAVRSALRDGDASVRYAAVNAGGYLPVVVNEALPPIATGDEAPDVREHAVNTVLSDRDVPSEVHHRVLEQALRDPCEDVVTIALVCAQYLRSKPSWLIPRVEELCKSGSVMVRDQAVSTLATLARAGTTAGTGGRSGPPRIERS